ncbi:MAG: Smr/MutS family protein [Tenericutes bacterium]|nr:Smr/MutS family protein [Mycoplasmatota bacterium]
MYKRIDPFLYNTPSIDIHGYDRYGGVALVKNFIDNSLRIDCKKIRIVHGHGEGILKAATHEYLKSDKRVLEYKLNIYNDGETIVILK